MAARKGGTTQERSWIFEIISRDGVISPAGINEYGGDCRQCGWTAPYRTAAGREVVAEAQGNSLYLLLGRRTKDLWRNYKPKSGKSPYQTV